MDARTTAAPARGAVSEAAAAGVVVAWDLPTRLAKWALAVLVGLAFASRWYGDEALVWHMWNGLAILTLVVFRLLWGLVGGSTARFSAFLRSPLAAIGYATALLRGRAPSYLGHNPLGGLMVVALLALVAAQGVTGLFTTDDILVDGPLVTTVDESIVSRASALHQDIYGWLLALIGLHVVANLGYSLLGRDNLVRAMISGRKPAAAYRDQAAATPGSVVLALVCLVLAAGIVFGGIALAGGNPFP